MSTADCFATIESRFRDWNYGHPKALYGLVRMLQPQSVVEVGTYRGYAACYLACALRDNGRGRLYCIDDFSEGMQKKYDPEHWHANLAACGLSDWAELRVGKSEDPKLWPDTVDLAYVDGWHSFTACLWDFRYCADRGAELIAVDDVLSTIGPRRLVHHVRVQFPHEWDSIQLHRDCGLALFARKKLKPEPTFSQELPDHPGTVLTGMDEEAVFSHLERAKEITKVNYWEYPL